MKLKSLYHKIAESIANNESLYADDAPCVLEAGANDNIFLHGGRIDPPMNALDKLLTLLLELSDDNYDAKNEIKSIVSKYRSIHLADPVIKLLTQGSGGITDKSGLYNFASELAFESDNCEEVKFGIALLAFSGCSEDDISRIKVLGLDEELTLFCVVTLNSLLVSPDTHIWELARNTYGWGRINSIEQLRRTSNQAIKRWMLRDGYNNTVMNEYTAYICATTGGLRGAIDVDIIDDELLEGTAGILNALLSNDIFGGVDDYIDAYAVASMYVMHVSRRGKGLKHFALLVRLKNYIHDPYLDKGKRRYCGWTDSNAAVLSDTITDILEKSHWRQDLIIASHNSYEDMQEDLRIAANYAGLDMWDANLKKLVSNPLNPYYWDEIFQQLTPERFPQIESIIKDAVPWKEISCNDDEYSYCHYAVEAILNGIIRYPGLSKAVLPCMIQSKLSQHKRAAVQVLNAWGREYWPDGIEDALRMMVDAEPGSVLTKSIHRMLDI